jgi:hypothetical protein
MALEKYGVEHVRHVAPLPVNIRIRLTHLTLAARIETIVSLITAFAG